ncbi:glycosyltransferase family 2 protein [Tabrizicola oligotrophica]|uniref:Glycosyltransferase n=1 Tax=Tabrizicola oligotrophica TaxID=2710650 RepID=A0A6M0QSC3_9RHOB|nr:glycosyltransferase [Tabrizicola oligotrophica]NEY90345.1 glycosyltransferase [Tabrizicola oligotrophica]
MADVTHFTIQSMLWPEAGITTERDLFFRLYGDVVHSLKGRSLTFSLGGVANFATSANLFNLGKWQRHCGQTDIILRLAGRGNFALIVHQAAPEKSWECIYSEAVELTPDAPYRLNLTPLISRVSGGVIFFELRALGDGYLNDASWETTAAPKSLPQLVLSITTFKREEAVRASVARFEAFMSRSELAPYLHLVVVDNGKSAEIQASSHVTPIANENLGGSGGFARGLLAAEERGASHCLFMDDDASIHMEAVERTWAFLAYAEDSRVAVAGGLTMANHRWALWECGAIFDRVCRPKWNGTDLRALPEVLKMEFDSTGAKPHNFYGGWWYFAFPIAHVKYRPFPFFVRGDDISFSIANDFEIATLPGVLCFQDADFSDKETLQTLYLDLRSHLAHHLSLPTMEIGRKGILRIVAQFFLRSMVQSHYETLQALRLAVTDVMEGPEFFVKNADMAERRARIGKMRNVEAYAPLQGMAPTSRRKFDPRRNKFLRTIMKYSLNGHLLPFFGYWGNTVTLKSSQRGQLNEVWGASRITYLNSEGTQSFTVRHSKLVAAREAVAILGIMGKLAWNYPHLSKMWRQGYAQITQGGFWSKKFEAGNNNPQV